MRYAGIISEQNNRLNRQVEKVLQLARIEQGNFSLNPEPVNLRDLLEPIIQSAEVKINDSGGRFTLDLQAPEGTTIQADRLHLTNMLHNLLDNAIKYCRETPDVTLRTALSPADQTLLISIIDRGIGIPKDHQSRVFQKFYRVPTGNVHNVKGFGLGLYYIRTICQAHGWRIRLESEEVHGTTVTLEVPLPPQ
jgi:two-component system phosphate regulon sensor histidine kinase PhoR